MNSSTFPSSIVIVVVMKWLYWTSQFSVAIVPIESDIRKKKWLTQFSRLNQNSKPLFIQSVSLCQQKNVFTVRCVPREPNNESAAAKPQLTARVLSMDKVAGSIDGILHNCTILVKYYILMQLIVCFNMNISQNLVRIGAECPLTGFNASCCCC